MSIENTAESCTNVLGIPSGKARDLSLYAKHQGFSCLGTWTREECLTIGEQLQSHDLDCRVIPFSGGSSVPNIISESDDIPGADGPAQSALVENSYLFSLST